MPVSARVGAGFAGRPAKLAVVDELVTVLDEFPPESARAHVYAAVQVCPVLALTLDG